MSNSDYTDGPMDAVIHPFARLVDHSWKLMALLGVLSIAIGVIALVWPGPSIGALGVLFGIYLLVYGVIQIMIGLAPMPSAITRVLLVVSGGLSLVLAFLAFRDQLQAVYLLALWIGIGWLFGGVARMVGGFEHLGRGGGWLVLGGIVELVAAFVIMGSPFESVATLVLMGGILLIAAGIVEVVSAFQARSAFRRVLG